MPAGLSCFRTHADECGLSSPVSYLLNLKDHHINLIPATQYSGQYLTGSLLICIFSSFSSFFFFNRYLLQDEIFKGTGFNVRVPLQH